MPAPARSRLARTVAGLAASLTAVLTVTAVGAAPAAARPAPSARPSGTSAFTTSLSAYGARCDGRHDDKAALEAALAAVHRHHGGTLLVPSGRCRIVQTEDAPATRVDGPVTIRGTSPTSELTIASDVPGGLRTLLEVRGPDVVMRDLRLARRTNVYAVLVDVYASTRFTLDHVTLDGQQAEVGGEDADGVKLTGDDPAGVIRDARITRSTVQDLSYGLFQASPSTVTTRGFTVDHSTFSRNHADDLEFNAPSASMTGISVTDSTFRDNQYVSPDAGAGFGVGVANVQHVRIARNSFRGYGYDPVHLEDRTAHVSITDNHFADSFTIPTSFNSMIFIVNDTHFVDIRRNVFDTAANDTHIDCVYVGTGGGTGPPTDVLVTQNRFLLRPDARTVGVYDALRVVERHNVVRHIP